MQARGLPSSKGHLHCCSPLSWHKSREPLGARDGRKEKVHHLHVSTNSVSWAGTSIKTSALDSPLLQGWQGKHQFCTFTREASEGSNLGCAQQHWWNKASTTFPRSSPGNYMCCYHQNGSPYFLLPAKGDWNPKPSLLNFKESVGKLLVHVQQEIRKSDKTVKNWSCPAFWIGGNAK